jgi:hypothetical protein
VRYDSITQGFGVLMHMMSETLNNGEPDAVRRKGERAMIAERRVNSLHKGMKEAISSC